MDRRSFLRSLFATSGAALIGAVGAAEAAPAEPASAEDLYELLGPTDPAAGDLAADLPAAGAQEAQWVNQCYWTRNSWGQRVRVCRRVRVRRRCWWTYDRWGRRVRVCR